MVDSVRAAAAANLRRDAILEAVAFTAERLLLSHDWAVAADEVLARLGIAADVSRAYVIENVVDEGRRETMVERAEWSAPGVSPQRDNPVLHGAPWVESGFGRWPAVLRRGGIVAGAIETFPVSEQGELRSQDIVSLCVLPVFAQDVWWGCVGFDDCDTDRDWNGPDLVVLRAAASALGAAIARQQVEGLRHEAERRYRTFVETIPAVTYTDIPTPNGSARMGFVSPQIESILGFPAQRFIDEPTFWVSLIHPEDLARLQASGAMSTQVLEPFEDEYRMRTADGRWIWVHDTSTTVLRDDGSVDYFQGFMVDVTARKEAEQQARLAEASVRTMIEQTPAMVYQEYLIDGRYDPDASTAIVTPHVVKLMGYTPEEWAQPGFWQRVTHPDDLPLVMAESDRVIAAGETVYRQEYRMRARDGRWVWFHDESALIADDDGRPLLWQGVMVDITARRDAEEQLRRTEERLRVLIENIPAVVYVEAADANPRDFYIGPQVSSIFGYSPEEWRWTEDFWLGRIHPDDVDRIRDAEEHSDRTHEAYTHEYRFRKADGTYVWVHDEAVFIPGDGDGGFWQGFLFDITPRVEAEQQLREAEETFRAIVEHSPAVIYTQDFDPADPSVSRTTYISPRQEDLTGYTNEEVMAEPTLWARQLHPDDHDRVLAADAVTNAGEVGTTFSMEYRLLRKDGRVIWVHDEAQLVELGDGRPFWQGFLLDVTERKRAEEELQESHQHVQAILETALDAVITMDESGAITGWNPQAETTFGWSRDRVIGRGLAETIIPPSLRAAHVSGLARYLETGEGPVLNRRIEVTAMDRRGREFPVELSIAPVRMRERTIFSAFIRDISERKRAEEDLARALVVEREAALRLRAVDEMKNTFLQAVSHDLRTPLAAILGLAITLERGDVELSEDDARDLAQRIAVNARRLERLVTNLLDMDRLARGIVEPQLQRVDVGALVREVVEESDLVPADRLRVAVEVAEAHVDAAKVERIVENLLANTGRHAPSSTVWVTVRRTAEGVELAVEDDGPGVPAELRERVFDPFRQGPGAPEHSPGVGVGLTLVRRFAELHGGRAWVQEREGGGASFRVVLPDQPAPAAAGVAGS